MGWGREDAERRKTLVKYIPDISRALLVVLTKMNETSPSSAPKRKKLLADVASGALGEADVKAALMKAVDHFEADSMLQVGLPANANLLLLRFAHFMNAASVRAGRGGSQRRRCKADSARLATVGGAAIANSARPHMRRRPVVCHRRGNWSADFPTRRALSSV